MGEYLIPANSKKSMLIIGMFNSTDIIILSVGLVLTLLLLFIVKTSSLLGISLILFPLLFCAFLVLPLPNVHNVRTFIINVYDYFMNQREYHWKGWCIRYGEQSK